MNDPQPPRPAATPCWPADAFPLSNPGEIYMQFPPDWTWPQAEAWLSEHGIRSTHKLMDMPYRWGAYRPIKGTQRPCDVFIYVKQPESTSPPEIHADADLLEEFLSQMTRSEKDELGAEIGKLMRLAREMNGQ